VADFSLAEAETRQGYREKQRGGSVLGSGVIVPQDCALPAATFAVSKTTRVRLVALGISGMVSATTHAVPN